MNYVAHTKFRYAVTNSPSLASLVTVEDVRAFAIIDLTADAAIDAADAALIQLLINSAYKYWLDWTGVFPLFADITATLDFTPTFPDVYLKYLPISEIEKVYGINTDASEEVADAADYVLDTDAGLVRSYDWPVGTKTLGQFNIDYKAGLAAAVADVPEDVKTAIKMLVTHWFEYRQPNTEKQIYRVPDHARAIMSQYKPIRL